MFGFGRRRQQNEVTKLQARERELVNQLADAHRALEEAQKDKGTAEERAQHLASHTRALAAKVHRLALQRLQLQGDNDRLQREHKQIGLENLKLHGEAALARAERSDYKEVLHLQDELRTQSAKYESKLNSLKRKTKALLTAVLLPNNTSSSGRTSAAGSRQLERQPSTASSHRADTDGQSLDWLSATDSVCSSEPLCLDEATLHQAKVLEILACLYDDCINEDEALQQLTRLAAEATQPAITEGQRSAAPAGLHLSRMLKADASTATSPRPVERRTAEAATETPADMSYLGSPYDLAATPLEPAGSPRGSSGGARPGVPALDIAALLAQAMDPIFMQNRSSSGGGDVTARTAASNAAATFASFTNFVLAEPEKLQRLIMRHATATGRQPQQPQEAAAPGMATLGRGSMGGLVDRIPSFGGQGAAGAAGSATARLTESLINRGLGASFRPSAASSASAAQPAAAPAMASSSSAVAPVAPAPAKTPKKAAAAIKFADVAPKAAAKPAVGAGGGMGFKFAGNMAALMRQPSHEDDLKRFEDGSPGPLKPLAAPWSSALVPGRQ